jgi:hypothetical protein
MFAITPRMVRANKTSSSYTTVLIRVTAANVYASSYIIHRYHDKDFGLPRGFVKLLLSQGVLLGL